MKRNKSTSRKTLKKVQAIPEKMGSLISLLSSERSIEAAFGLAGNKKVSLFSDHFEILKTLSSLDLHVIKRMFAETKESPKVFLEDFISIFLSVVFIDDQSSLVFLGIGLFQLFLGVFQSSQKSIDRLLRQFSAEKGEKEGKLAEVLMSIVEKFGFPINEFLLARSRELWITFEDFEAFYVNPDNIIHYKKVDTKDMLLISTPMEADVKKRRMEPFKITSSTRKDRFGSSIRKADVIHELDFMLILEENSDTIRFFSAKTLQEEFSLSLNLSKHKQKKTEITDFCFLKKEWMLCASAMDGSLCFWGLDKNYREKEEMNWKLGVYIPIESRTPVLGSYEFALATNDNPLNVWYSLKFGLVITTSIYSTISCWEISEIDQIWQREKNFWRNDGLPPQGRQAAFNDQVKSKSPGGSPGKFPGMGKFNFEKEAERKQKLLVKPKNLDIGVNGRITDCIEIKKIDSFMFSSYEKKIVIWNYPLGEVFHILELKLTSAHHILWLPKTNYIIPCCFDRVLEVYELGNTEEFSLAGRLVGHSYEIVCALALPDFEMVITVDENSNVRSWSMVTFKTTQNFQLESTSRVTQIKRISQNTFVVVSKNLAFFRIEQGEFEVFEEEEEKPKGKLKSSSGSFCNKRQKPIPKIHLEVSEEGEKKLIIGTSDSLMFVSLDRECIEKMVGERDWFFKSSGSLSAFSFSNLPYCQLAIGDKRGRVFMVPERTHLLKEKPRVVHPFLVLNAGNNQENQGKQSSDSLDEEKFSERIEIIINDQLRTQKSGLSTLKWKKFLKGSKERSVLKGNIGKERAQNGERNKEIKEYPLELFTHLEKQMISVVAKHSLTILKMDRFCSLARIRMLSVRPDAGFEIEEGVFLEEKEIFGLHFSNHLVMFVCFYTFETKFILANFDSRLLSEFLLNDFSSSLLPVNSINSIGSSSKVNNIPGMMSPEDISVLNTPLRKPKNPRVFRRQTVTSSPSGSKRNIEAILQSISDLNTGFRPIKSILILKKFLNAIAFLDEEKNIQISWSTGSGPVPKMKTGLVLASSDLQKSVAKVTAKDLLEDSQGIFLIYGDSRGCITFLDVSPFLNGIRADSIWASEAKEEKDPNFKTIRSLGSEKMKDIMKDTLSTRIHSGYLARVETQSIKAADSLAIDSFIEEGIETIKSQEINGKQYLIMMAGNLVVRVFDLSAIIDFIKKSAEKFGGKDLVDGGYNKREKVKEKLSPKWVLIEINMSLRKILKWDDHNCRDSFLKTQVKKLKEIFQKNQGTEKSNKPNHLASEITSTVDKMNQLAIKRLPLYDSVPCEPQIQAKRLKEIQIFKTQPVASQKSIEDSTLESNWPIDQANLIETGEFLKKMDEIEVHRELRRHEMSFKGMKERVMQGDDLKMKSILQEVESRAFEIMSTSREKGKSEEKKRSEHIQALRRGTKAGQVLNIIGMKPRVSTKPKQRENNLGNLPSLSNHKKDYSIQSKSTSNLILRSPERSLVIESGTRESNWPPSYKGSVFSPSFKVGSSTNQPKGMISSGSEVPDVKSWNESFVKGNQRGSKPKMKKDQEKTIQRSEENEEKSRSLKGLKAVKGKHQKADVRASYYLKDTGISQLFSPSRESPGKNSTETERISTKFLFNSVDKNSESSFGSSKLSELIRKDVLKQLYFKMNKAKFSKVHYVQLEKE